MRLMRVGTITLPAPLRLATATPNSALATAAPKLNDGRDQLFAAHARRRMRQWQHAATSVAAASQNAFVNKEAVRAHKEGYGDTFADHKYVWPRCVGPDKIGVIEAGGVQR